MEEQSAVVFRNVGQLYFPQTRVECHYSLSPDHQWSSRDWIGIFEVGWTSLKQYHTYTWALVPDTYTGCTSVNQCVIFRAFYLPCPSDVEYEFIYADKKGEVCARSRPFKFCAPKPLEELETLKEEGDEDDGEEELLLVIPRAQLLQSRLEECLKQQADMQQALSVTIEEMDNGKEESKIAKMEWELERAAMKEEIAELSDNMRLNYKTLKKIEGKHKDVKYYQENLTSEMSKVMAEKAECQQQIQDLEEYIKVLNGSEKEGNVELERLKERLNKMSSQMKYDEEKRKSLQVESKAALDKVRGLQEHLEASEQVAESLRRELRELGTRQGHTHTELHQARLQVAQITLQLSEENLLLREERANWAIEREAYKHAAEIDKKKTNEVSCDAQRTQEWLQEERMERDKLETELGRERDCNRVLLNDTKQELQELKASLKRAKREREEQQAEKQDLLNYICQLEQRLAIVPDTKCNAEILTCMYPSSSSEDEDKPSSASSKSFLSIQPERTERADISPGTHAQNKGDTPASGTQDVNTQHTESRAGEGKRPILPGFFDPVLSGLTDSPMW